jgi:hypothetical protein
MQGKRLRVRSLLRLYVRIYGRPVRQPTTTSCERSPRMRKARLAVRVRRRCGQRRGAGPGLSALAEVPADAGQGIIEID